MNLNRCFEASNALAFVLVAGCLAALGCTPKRAAAPGPTLVVGSCQSEAVACSGKDDDCCDREVCRLQGMCSKRGDGVCVAKTDAQCRASLDCAVAGLCVQFADRCIAKTPENCKGSWGCREHARCSTRGGEKCDVGSDTDCKNSELCSKEGKCVLSSTSYDSGECVANSDDDCQRSKACSDESRCRHERGACIRE